MYGGRNSTHGPQKVRFHQLVEGDVTVDGVRSSVYSWDRLDGRFHSSLESWPFGLPRPNPSHRMDKGGTGSCCDIHPLLYPGPGSHDPFVLEYRLLLKPVRPVSTWTLVEWHYPQLSFLLYRSLLYEGLFDPVKEYTDVSLGRDAPRLFRGSTTRTLGSV